jgi:putative restriction endonuclease
MAEEPSYYEGLLRRILDTEAEVDASPTWHRPGPVYSDPRLSPHRLGQQSFKAVVLQAYSHRCAITGDKVWPILQAAHIRPLPAGGEHRLDNGLLLRSDVHTLFDRGYLGVDPRHRLLVSPRLREQFGNGDFFYARASSPLPEVAPNRSHRSGPAGTGTKPVANSTKCRARLHQRQAGPRAPRTQRVGIPRTPHRSRVRPGR